MTDSTDTARLLITCDDQPGIVAAVAGLMARVGANIISLDQHSTDAEGGKFFQRTVFHIEGFGERRPEIEQMIAELAAPFGMEWSLHDASQRKRVAIFVSQYDHCLLDLLWRVQRGDLDIDIVCVVSNHTALEQSVANFGVPFVHIPSTDKAAMEAKQLDLLAGAVDLVVLARYMQILSDDFIQKVGAPVINIHHSFLPAFIGANPYARAKERGVKLIGATAHYATAELDQGPIICQEVTPVSHRDTPERLIRLGGDLEQTVLARAVRLHLERRILTYANRTVIFD